MTRRLCIAMGLLCAAAFLMSLRWRLGVTAGPRWDLWLAWGRVTISWPSAPTPAGSPAGVGLAIESLPPDLKWGFRWTGGIGWGVCTIPLLPPAAVAAVAWWALRRRRFARPGWRTIGNAIAQVWWSRWLRGAAALAAGIAATVALAWLSAYLFDTPAYDSRQVARVGATAVWTVDTGSLPGGAIETWVPLWTLGGRPSPDVQAWRTASEAARYDRVAAHDPILKQSPLSRRPRWPGTRDGVPPQAQESVQVVRHLRGWPWPALYCYREAVVDSRRSVVWPLGDITGAIVLDTPAVGPGAPWGALPYLPVLPGFILDAALYAAGAFLLLSIPETVRRRRRRRAGQCVGCGYDLAGIAAPRCPECGSDAPARGSGSKFGGTAKT